MPGKEKSCLSKDGFDTRENGCKILVGKEMRRAGEFSTSWEGKATAAPKVDFDRSAKGMI